MAKSADSVMWVVSFQVDELGKPLEYSIDEFDLSRCNPRAAMAIRAELGKGVFRTEQEAKQWVQSHLKVSARGCASRSCHECQCGCGRRQE